MNGIRGDLKYQQFVRSVRAQDGIARKEILGEGRQGHNTRRLLGMDGGNKFCSVWDVVLNDKRN